MNDPEENHRNCFHHVEYTVGEITGYIASLKAQQRLQKATRDVLVQLKANVEDIPEMVDQLLGQKRVTIRNARSLMENQQYHVSRAANEQQKEMETAIAHHMEMAADAFARLRDDCDDIAPEQLEEIQCHMYKLGAELNNQGILLYEGEGKGDDSTLLPKVKNNRLSSRREGYFRDIRLHKDDAPAADSGPTEKERVSAVTATVVSLTKYLDAIPREEHADMTPMLKEIRETCAKIPKHMQEYLENKKKARRRAMRLYDEGMHEKADNFSRSEDTMEEGLGAEMERVAMSFALVQREAKFPTHHVLEIGRLLRQLGEQLNDEGIVLYSTETLAKYNKPRKDGYFADIRIEGR